MKHILLNALIIIISMSIKAQTYYFATAIKTGNWSDDKKWNYAVRQDGKKLTSIVIPQNVTITLNEDQEVKLTWRFQVRSR